MVFKQILNILITLNTNVFVMTHRPIRDDYTCVSLRRTDFILHTSTNAMKFIFKCRMPKCFMGPPYNQR